MKKKPRDWTYKDFESVIEKRIKNRVADITEYDCIMQILMNMPKKKKSQSNAKYEVQVEDWWQENKHKYINMENEKEYEV